MLTQEECEFSWTAGQKKIILKWEQMIEFYKYLYAGGLAFSSHSDYQKISQKWEIQPNVSSCPAVQLTSHLYIKSIFMSIYRDIVTITMV